MKNTVIFSAPQGWGKTLRADELKKTYGCNAIVEEWSPGKQMTPGALHLTNEQITADHDTELTALGFMVVREGWEPRP